MRDELTAGQMPPDEIRSKNFPSLYRDMGSLVGAWIAHGKPGRELRDQAEGAPAAAPNPASG